jgi:hypothetical protein
MNTQTNISEIVAAKFTAEMAMPIDNIIINGEYAYCVSGSNQYWCRIINNKKVKTVRGTSFRLEY